MSLVGLLLGYLVGSLLGGARREVARRVATMPARTLNLVLTSRTVALRLAARRLPGVVPYHRTVVLRLPARTTTVVLHPRTLTVQPTQEAA